VPEDSAARVRDGAPIAVTLDAHPGATFSARVNRIFPDIDRRTHARTVEGAITGDVALVPGMFARLQLTLASAPEALTVPVESVVRRRGKPVVFVIAGDGTARQRAVRLGIESHRRVQILAGVAEGDPVAVAGHNRLRDGKKVRVAGGRDAPSRASRGGGKPR
jgi:membrane fusion protein (multidrug efflux system)